MNIFTIVLIYRRLDKNDELNEQTLNESPHDLSVELTIRPCINAQSIAFLTTSICLAAATGNEMLAFNISDIVNYSMMIG